LFPDPGRITQTPPGPQFGILRAHPLFNKFIYVKSDVLFELLAQLVSSLSVAP
jgi:hypothetical protein